MSSLRQDFPVSKVCLLNFLEETADVTDWYMLGLYMGVPSKDLSHIERQFSSQRSARCRAELFDVWMKRTPNASWELIAAALHGEIRRNCTGRKNPQNLSVATVHRLSEYYHICRDINCKSGDRKKSCRVIYNSGDEIH